MTERNKKKVDFNALMKNLPQESRDKLPLEFSTLQIEANKAHGNAHDEKEPVLGTNESTAHPNPRQKNEEPLPWKSPWGNQGFEKLQKERRNVHMKILQTTTSKPRVQSLKFVDGIVVVEYSDGSCPRISLDSFKKIFGQARLLPMPTFTLECRDTPLEWLLTLTNEKQQLQLFLVAIHHLSFVGHGRCEAFADFVSRLRNVRTMEMDIIDIGIGGYSEPWHYNMFSFRSHVKRVTLNMEKLPLDLVYVTNRICDLYQGHGFEQLLVVSQRFFSVSGLQKILGKIVATSTPDACVTLLSTDGYTKPAANTLERCNFKFWFNYIYCSNLYYIFTRDREETHGRLIMIGLKSC